MSIPACTLITACFDLTQYHTGSRSLEASIANMQPLLTVPCYLVIFTDQNCIEEIKRIRSNLNSLTQYIVIDFTELEFYKYVDLIKKNRIEYHPTKDERTCAESHMLCCSKFNFVLQVMKTNPFNTSKFGWIDANIGANFSKICTNYENHMLLHILNNISEKFHIQVLNVCDKKYMDTALKKEMYLEYRWIVCGSLFTCGFNSVAILNRLNELFIETTQQGFGHAEEMFYLEVLDEFYDDIERGYGDYHMILNNFLRPSKGFDYILEFIIKRYNHFGYHREAYDCCRKIVNEIEQMHVPINYQIYFDVLFQNYIATFYYKQDEAASMVKHIMDLVSANPFIKNEYDKNSGFYDSQFAFCLH
jgi:hypothetical protein